MPQCTSFSSTYFSSKSNPYLYEGLTRRAKSIYILQHFRPGPYLLVHTRATSLPGGKPVDLLLTLGEIEEGGVDNLLYSSRFSSFVSYAFPIWWFSRRLKDEKRELRENFL